MKKTIITVAGRTAAGKSLIAKKLADKLSLKVLQSYTTRQPRPDEIADPEHSDHIFISDEEFDKLTDIAAETEINGVRYCTTMEKLNECDFYVIDPEGINYLKDKHGRDFRIVQFYIYADEKVRKERFKKRGKKASDFDSRNTAEDEQFKAYEDYHKYDIIIYNNRTIDEAVEMMSAYVSIVMEDRLKEIEARKNGTWIEPEEKVDAETDMAKTETAEEQEPEGCTDTVGTEEMPGEPGEEETEVFEEPEMPAETEVSVMEEVPAESEKDTETSEEDSDKEFDPFSLDDLDDEEDTEEPEDKEEPEDEPEDIEENESDAFDPFSLDDDEDEPSDEDMPECPETDETETDEEPEEDETESEITEDEAGESELEESNEEFEEPAEKKPSDDEDDDDFEAILLD